MLGVYFLRCAWLLLKGFAQSQEALILFNGNRGLYRGQLSLACPGCSCHDTVASELSGSH